MPPWPGDDEAYEVPGTWGAEVLDALRPRAHELVIDKHGYSAFAGTALEETLRRFPQWSVDLDRPVPLHTSTVRGYTELPITF